jgi:hypothetical protein
MSRAAFARWFDRFSTAPMNMFHRLFADASGIGETKVESAYGRTESSPVLNFVSVFPPIERQKERVI